MRSDPHYPVLHTLLQPLNGHCREAVRLVLSGIITCGAARSLAVAQQMSEWLDIRCDSAVNRLRRLLRNPRFPAAVLTEQTLSFLSKKLGDRLLIAVDWTEWCNELRMLVAGAVVGKRAIPVQTEAFTKSDMPRSQNTRENTFMRLLNNSLNEAGVRAVILCDRGFRRASWLKILLGLSATDFVIRLMDDAMVQIPKLGWRALGKLRLQPGDVMDLGKVPLHADSEVTVRIIGVWQKGAREPWWLATNLDEPVEKIVAYYDRRMTVEEQIRDTKGCRFGVKLVWTQFQKPDHLSHFAQLVGIAILVWTAAGIVAAQLKPTLRMNHKTKGPRQSYVTIGIRAATAVPAILKKSPAALMQILLTPDLRVFAWLHSANRPDPTATPAPK